MRSSDRLPLWQIPKAIMNTQSTSNDRSNTSPITPAAAIAARARRPDAFVARSRRRRAVKVRLDGRCLPSSTAAGHGAAPALYGVRLSLQGVRLAVTAAQPLMGYRARPMGRGGCMTLVQHALDQLEGQSEEEVTARAVPEDPRRDRR